MTKVETYKCDKTGQYLEEENITEVATYNLRNKRGQDMGFAFQTATDIHVSTEVANDNLNESIDKHSRINIITIAMSVVAYRVDSYADTGDIHTATFEEIAFLKDLTSWS